jgi:hypothetical protein
MASMSLTTMIDLDDVDRAELRERMIAALRAKGRRLGLCWLLAQADRMEQDMPPPVSTCGGWRSHAGDLDPRRV